MEDELDEIAAGDRAWVPVLREFWVPFSQTLQLAQEQMEPVVIPDKPTDEVCPQCGRPMVLKLGRFGWFYGCTGFPACRGNKGFFTRLGIPCPECGGEIVERQTRKRRVFYGCNQYPDCEWTSWKRPIETRCPSCGGMLVEEGQKGFTCLACEMTFESGEVEEQGFIPCHLELGKGQRRSVTHR
jgi:DNA topoisomerase-1